MCHNAYDEFHIFCLYQSYKEEFISCKNNNLAELARRLTDAREAAAHNEPPPLCYSSVWLSMNVLVLDYKTVYLTKIIIESEVNPLKVDRDGNNSFFRNKTRYFILC